MKMETVVHLDKDDLALIVASHFEVPIEAVSIRAKRVYKGYGPMEHVEYECAATVTTGGDKQHG